MQRRLRLGSLIGLLPSIANFEIRRSFHSQQLLDEIAHGAPAPAPTCLASLAASHPLELVRSRLRSAVALDPTAVAMALKQSRGTCGLQIHGLVVSSGLDAYVPVLNSLMNMYCKSDSFSVALKIFDVMHERDVVSWNTVLSGFASGVEALEFAGHMRRVGVPLDPVTFTVALSFAADVQDLESGRQFHSLVFKSGFDPDIFIGNALITAYSRSGCLHEAKRVFDEMTIRDLVSWNSLLCGLSQAGNCMTQAIQLFLRMVTEGERPDHISLASIISACRDTEDISFGRQVHGFSMKMALETHVLVSNVLMSMYYKHGETNFAKKIFENMTKRNVISWTTLISMDSENAVSLFNGMRLDGVQPNDVTFVALIYAVTNNHLIREGQMIHGVCLRTGMSCEVNVSNSLVTMYGNLRSTADARKVFDSMFSKEIISWNALISCYAQNGQCEEALEAFSSLILQCQPNQYTFGSILSAITTVQTMSMLYGQKLHCYIIKLGLNTNEYVCGALIDMYAKHGSIHESHCAFNESTRTSLVSWTAIISAHAKHGDSSKVINIFEDMVHRGVQPDHLTFLAVLVACGCKGMVDMGCKIYELMIHDYKFEPWPEHYACMVDMLGKAGRLVEAEEFLRQTPGNPGISAFQSLLGACRTHGDVEMGTRVAEALMRLGPNESGTYVLMSNIYAERGDWESVAKIRKGMRQSGVTKEVGFSWVDVGIRDSIHMHKFSSGDKTHPSSEEIFIVAKSLGLEMSASEEELCIDLFF